MHALKVGFGVNYNIPNSRVDVLIPGTSDTIVVEDRALKEVS